MLIHIRTMMKASWWLTLACFLLQVGRASSLGLVIVSSGQVIGELTDGTGRGTVDVWLALLVVGLVAGPGMDALSLSTAAALQSKYVVLVHKRIAEVGLANDGIAHLQDEEIVSRLRAVIQSARDWTFMSGVQSTWVLVGMRMNGISALLIVGSWNLLAAALLVLAWMFMSKAFGKWSRTIFDQLLESTGGERRKAEYYRQSALAVNHFKTIRVFGSAPWIIQQYTVSWQAAMSVVWKHRVSAVGPIFFAGVIVLVMNIGSFALLAHESSSGVISVAVFVYVAQSIPHLVSFGMLGDVQMAVSRATVIIGELSKLHESATSVGSTDMSERTHFVSKSLGANVLFNDVTYKYPNQISPAILGLSLQIFDGETVAIVGMNGAGKSTMVNLLLGACKPGSGIVEISVDGTACSSREAGTGVVLQNFSRYPLSLGKNIVINPDGNPLTEEQLNSIYVKSSLMGHVQAGEGLENDKDSNSGYKSLYLSEGEWQRVAVARALASNGGAPRLLILDEPTSALDISAEIALFRDFQLLAPGSTKIIITHRLSSIRDVDRIIVMEDGRVIEEGTHSMLMKRNGRYSQMFRTQASRFESAPTQMVEVL